MARFYFDTAAAEETGVVDRVGIDLPDLGTARTHALAGLADLARDEIGRGADVFTVTVRDEGGAVLYGASLTLTEIRHSEDAGL